MNQRLIDQYKAQLLAKREELISAVKDMEQSILESVRSMGDTSNAPTHPTTASDKGVDENVDLAENEEGILEEVEMALERIENGAYGQCENCKLSIPEERLEAIPYTRYCVACTSRGDNG